MSSVASESTTTEERTDERREYYRSLQPIEAQVLMLERQSKTHRLGKSVREEVRSLADTLLDVAEQGDVSARRITDLETALARCEKNQQIVVCCVDELRETLETWRDARPATRASPAVSDTEPPSENGSTNCFAAPLVTLWRTLSRHKHRTAYSRVERGEFDSDAHVVIDDNEVCMTGHFAKTE